MCTNKSTSLDVHWNLRKQRALQNAVEEDVLPELKHAKKLLCAVTNALLM